MSYGSKEFHQGICAFSGRTGYAADQVVLFRRDGSVTCYGAAGGARTTVEYLLPDECVVAVIGHQMGRFRGREIVLLTNRGRALKLAGSGPIRARDRFEFRAGAGESIVDLEWSHSDRTQAHAVVTGVVTRPDHVLWIGARTGGALDRLELGMRDGSVRAYGTHEGTTYERVFLDGKRAECITEVRAKQAGRYLAAIQFITSTGRCVSLPEGEWRTEVRGGHQVETFKAPAGRCIVDLT
jgi:hypothetical protein